MKKISFPLGVAEGQYFCNRVKETNLLIRNIQNSTHTVLISPRRYGKTSLAYRAIQQSQLPNARADFYMTTDTHDVERAIIASVDNLLSQISSNAEMLLSLIKDYIKFLRPSFEAGTHGLKIKLEPVHRSTSAANICEALKILDGVLEKKGMRAVLFFDEFQEIQRVAPDQGIEGAIRHVAQETEHFTILFSGSHRRLLKSMFNDRNKPLYRLCDEIQLERISKEDYFPFIEKLSRENWGEPLSGQVINKILEYSELHSYYINMLCEKIFAKPSLPIEEEVGQVWNDLMTIKKKDVLGETKGLTVAHKKLLVAIAHGVDNELTGQKFLSRTELSGASAFRALEYLEEQDFIEKKDYRYRIIDPLLKNLIHQLTYF